jgi:hypothetical protein
MMSQEFSQCCIKKNIIALVFIFLFAIGTAFIAQRKLHISTHIQSKDSKFDYETLANDQVTVTENPTDPKFQQLTNRTITSTNNVTEEDLHELNSASYKQKWYRETYLATKERLKQTDKSQTVHGTIGPKQLFENIDKPAAVHAKTRGKGYVSSSMIIDGAYSLGQLEPATYGILLIETSKTPAIKVHTVEIKKDQPSLPINFEFGTASVSVHIYDEKGNPLDSNDVQLLIGGTASDIHMYKRSTGVKQGLWQVDHLYEGQYYARARWNGNTVGGLFDFVEGRNEIELSLKKQNARLHPGLIRRIFNRIF